MEMNYFDTKYDNDMVPIKTNDKEIASIFLERKLFSCLYQFFYLYEMKLEPFDSYKQENNN